MNARYGQKWQKKAADVSEFLADIGKPVDSLISKYQGTRFVDGADRALVFAEVLSSNPSDDVINYLDNRCTEGLGHFRDSRSGAEYAADLIISWIQEDALLRLLNDAGVVVELDGTDRDREFLSGVQVTTTSDFVVVGTREKRKLEVAYDSTGHWRKSRKFDLRDAKFVRLVSESAIVLGVAVPSREGFVLDLSKELECDVKDVPHHPIYRKPAKAIMGIDRLLVPLAEAIESVKILV